MDDRDAPAGYGMGRRGKADGHAIFMNLEKEMVDKMQSRMM